MKLAWLCLIVWARKFQIWVAQLIFKCWSFWGQVMAPQEILIIFAQDFVPTSFVSLTIFSQHFVPTSFVAWIARQPTTLWAMTSLINCSRTSHRGLMTFWMRFLQGQCFQEQQQDLLQFQRYGPLSTSLASRLQLQLMLLLIAEWTQIRRFHSSWPCLPAPHKFTGWYLLLPWDRPLTIYTPFVSWPMLHWKGFNFEWRRC